MQTFKELFVGGEWVAPDSSEVIEVISPASEEVIGQVPHASWLARHLLAKVRPWIEPAQSYEKHQLGLGDFFLNSLSLAWTMCLLADTVVLLRACALRRHPEAALPLAELTPKQLSFHWP